MPDPTDAASLKGQGRTILLPNEGNPFGEPTPASIPEDETPDLTPAEIAGLFNLPPPLAETPRATAELLAPESAPAFEDAPVPESVLASSDALASESAASTEIAPSPFVSFENTPAEVNPMTTSSSAADETIPAPGAEPLSVAPEEAPMLAEAEATFAAEVSAPAMESVPAFASAPAPASAPTPASVPADPLKVLDRDVGPSKTAYVPAEALTSDEALVGMFVTDKRLMELWLEINELERRVSTQAGISEKGADELINRLQAARNKLMHRRDEFEEANGEVAQVRYRLAQISRSGPEQHSRFILAYLLAFMALVVVGFSITGRMADLYSEAVPDSADNFTLIWHTILWGGIGGLTGALYGLWRHVAAERDYDPQFALWYYTNPLMGVVLGAFVYVLMNMTILLAEGLPGALSTNPGAGNLTLDSTRSVSPYLLYFFAWVVGFQQNYVFRLIDNVLNSVFPAKKKDS